MSGEESLTETRERWRKWAEDEALLIGEVAEGANVGRDAAAMMLAANQIKGAMVYQRETMEAHRKATQPLADAVTESVAEIKRIRGDDAEWKGEA